MFYAFQVVLVVKNPPASAGDVRDASSIPGSERSPGGGHGNPLQYSCLENPMGRGAWRAIVHRVAESRTWLSDLACRDTPMMCGECVVHSTSHSWRPSLTQIPQDQLWPQCPVSRQRKDSRERISLLNPKDVTHIASAYISLMRTGHMVPHNFKGVSEVWSLVKHLFLSNKSVWSAGSMNLW